MTPVLEETITLDFITTDSTGAAADATGTPTVEVFENATDTTLAGATVTKRTSKTGNYRVAIPCTAANGYEINKSYNVIVSATVGGIAAKALVGSFQVRTDLAAAIAAIQTAIDNANNAFTVVGTASTTSMTVSGLSITKDYRTMEVEFLPGTGNGGTRRTIQSQSVSSLNLILGWTTPFGVAPVDGETGNVV